MLKLRYDPAYGSRYQYLPVPASKFYLDYNTYDPLNIYEPTRHRYWYPHYWPSHLLDYIPTKYSLRQLRKMLQIKYFPGEGYNYQFMPDYRFYCDAKIHTPLSSLYDWPYKTRIWYPYKNLRLYFDYMPSRVPFREQRIRRVLYHQRLRD